MRGVALITLAIGLLGVAVGGGAFWLSQGVPDGSEQAQRFALARLGSGPVPQGKVRIEGRLDPGASTSLARGGVEDTLTYYAAFRADEDAKDAPVRLFVERGTRPETLNTLQGFMPEQTGYLIENGVPERALAELRGRGIRVASPALSAEDPHRCAARALLYRRRAGRVRRADLPARRACRPVAGAAPGLARYGHPAERDSGRAGQPIGRYSALVWVARSAGRPDFTM